MDQKTVDTRQRAEQLLAEAISIWKQSSRSESIEGLEHDPVFGVLMSAVAYQSNEIDDEIERMKQEVLDDYVASLLPYDESHPMPSLACISVFPSAGTAEVEMNSSSVFLLSGTNFQFIPILRTKVLPARLGEVAMMDGRRWKVSLSFDKPVNSLEGFSFAIRSHSFRDVRVFAGDFEIPLVRPWEYSSMPYSDIFSLDHTVYNGSDLYDPSSCVSDLFATQDIRLFCVCPHDAKQYIPDETQSLELTFEFTGITPDFSFNRKQIALNAVMLANVKICETNLDSMNPVVRIGAIDGRSEAGQFMYALKPSDSQVHAGEKIRVRHVSADRFNRSSLVKLLSSLLDRVKSDYSAFRGLQGSDAGGVMASIEEQISKLRALSLKESVAEVQGTYIMLDNPKTEASLKVRYLVTDGAAVTDSLTSKSTFSAAAGLSLAETEPLGEPVPGYDRADVNVAPSLRIQYALQTGERLVTPSDIKIFCRKELLDRYAISSDLIKSLSVRNRLQTREDRNGNASGYMIEVDIDIADTGFVRRSFAGRVPQAETILEKMIEVRSTAVYPVTVNITIL